MVRIVKEVEEEEEDTVEVMNQSDNNHAENVNLDITTTSKTENTISNSQDQNNGINSKVNNTNKNHNNSVSTKNNTNNNVNTSSSSGTSSSTVNDKCSTSYGKMNLGSPSSSSSSDESNSVAPSSTPATTNATGTTTNSSSSRVIQNTNNTKNSINDNNENKSLTIKSKTTVNNTDLLVEETQQQNSQTTTINGKATTTAKQNGEGKKYDAEQKKEVNMLTAVKEMLDNKESEKQVEKKKESHHHHRLGNPVIIIENVDEQKCTTTSVSSSSTAAPTTTTNAMTTTSSTSSRTMTASTCGNEQIANSITKDGNEKTMKSTVPQDTNQYNQGKSTTEFDRNSSIKNTSQTCSPGENSGRSNDKHESKNAAVSGGVSTEPMKKETSGLSSAPNKSRYSSAHPNSHHFHHHHHHAHHNHFNQMPNQHSHILPHFHQPNQQHMIPVIKKVISQPHIFDGPGQPPNNLQFAPPPPFANVYGDPKCQMEPMHWNQFPLIPPQGVNTINPQIPASPLPTAFPLPLDMSCPPAVLPSHPSTAGHSRSPSPMNPSSTTSQGQTLMTVEPVCLPPPVASSNGNHNPNVVFSASSSEIALYPHFPVVPGQYVVFFHINPGVLVSFHVGGDHIQVVKGNIAI